LISLPEENRFISFFENGIVFNSGLGIDGHWYINDTGNYTDFSLAFGNSSLQGSLEILAADTQLYYDDKLRYGNFYIQSWSEAINKMMIDYGPDFLNIRYPQADIHPKVRSALPPEFFQPQQLIDSGRN